MTDRIPLRRSLVLILSLLSGCGAAQVPPGGVRQAATGSPAPAAARPLAAAAGRPVPRTDAADFLTGQFAASQDDMDAAATALLRALAHDPGSQQLQQAAFQAALYAGRPEALKLAAGLPDSIAAQLLLADADAQAGAWSRARTRYAALPRQSVGEILQPLLIAWSQQGAGNTDAALATLRPAVEGQRFRAVYALHAGMLADLAGRTADATRFYGIARAEYGSVNLELARSLASWEARQGHPAEAAQTMDALVSGTPDLAMVAPRLRADVATRQVRRATDGIAEAYLAMAAALRGQNGNDLARVLLQLAIQLRPDFTAARLLMSDLLDGARDARGALLVLAPVPADDPLASLVQLRRAALLDASGQHGQALAVLDELQAALPDRPEPFALRGDVLRGQDRFAEATQAYDGAIARVPNPTPANWPLFYDRGVALERAHDWPRAEADLKHALQLAPDQPVLLNYLGYSWADQGRNLPEARAMIEHALAARPNDGAIIDSLGWVELKQGHVDKAVSLLEHAAELMPEDATVNGHLGDAYQAAGRHAEAQFQWRRALNLKPEPDEVPKLEAKLRDGTQAAAAPPPTPAAGPSAGKVVR